MSARDAARHQSTASYIDEMTGELARMAQESRHDTLAYLLGLAQLEARQIEDSGAARSIQPTEDNGGAKRAKLRNTGLKSV